MNMYALSSQEAATSLGNQLREKPWYLTIGVAGQPDSTPPSSTLIVYVKKKHPDQCDIAPTWMGYSVRVVVSGQPHPA
jgi:hypothetical protein